MQGQTSFVCAASAACCGRQARGHGLAGALPGSAMAHTGPGLAGHGRPSMQRLCCVCKKALHWAGPGNYLKRRLLMRYLS